MQSRSLGALIASDYGRLLAVKLALVAALLALALRNRVALTPAVARGEAAAARALSRAVRAEILIGLAVLALASGFRLTPPPARWPPRPSRSICTCTAIGPWRT